MVPLGAERERRRQVAGAAILQRPGGVGEERLGQQVARLRTDRRQLRNRARRQEPRRDAQRLEEAGELVLHHVGQRPDHQQRLRGVRRLGRQRQRRRQRREAGVLALGEGGLDAAAGIVQHPDPRGVPAVEPLRSLPQIQLDHLRRAGADQEQLPDVGPALQQAVDHPVQFLVGVGKASQVALLDDRGAEARLREDHHPRRRLHQMGTGARADDQEEGVLDLAVQPDDAGQAAEHLALAPLAQDRGVGAAGGRRAGWGGTGIERAHGVASIAGGIAGSRRAAIPPPRAAASWRRAARSFSTNCAALTT